MSGENPPRGIKSRPPRIAQGETERRVFPDIGENFSAREANPRSESYITFPHAPDNRSGVGKDGKKGKKRADSNSVVTYAGSDDVISWLGAGQA